MNRINPLHSKLPYGTLVQIITPEEFARRTHQYPKISELSNWISTHQSKIYKTIDRKAEAYLLDTPGERFYLGSLYFHVIFVNPPVSDKGF
jgi:hypothetical protein